MFLIFVHHFVLITVFGVCLIQCGSGISEKRGAAGKDTFFKKKKKTNQATKAIENHEEFYFVSSTREVQVQAEPEIEIEVATENEIEEVDSEQEPKSETKTDMNTAMEKSETSQMFTAIPEEVPPKKARRRMTVPELIYHFENLEI